MKYLAVLFAFSLGVAPARMASAGSGASAAVSQTGAGNRPSQSIPSGIRPGDVLDIQVSGEQGLSKSYTVDAAGKIALDMVGQVTVGGKTAEQVAADLRARLSRFLRQPSVTVNLGTLLRQECLVLGEVPHPGPVKLRPGDALLDALVAVGGLAPGADAAHATLARRGHPRPQAINLELLAKGDLTQNLPLTDGDIVQVPRKEVATFQITGEVKQPGTRGFDRPITLLDAIMAAGGLTDAADRSHITLTHKGENEPTVVDLDQVLAGGPAAAPAIQSGDVLSVPSRMLIQVVGEVRTPGERLLRNGGSLMEAVLLAGGFTPEADRAAIQVTHRDAKTETFSLADVNSVVGGPAVRAGDLVLVGHAKPQTINITGAVRSAGPLRYQDGMKITDALMAAGGLTENAKWKEIRVLRDQNDKDHQILVFDLERYLKAPQTDNMALRPGDQIFVQAQTHRSGSNLLQRLVQVLPLAHLFFPF